MAQNYDPPKPAGEEGGAPLMVKEGVMDNPKIEVIFGIHIDARSTSRCIMLNLFSHLR